VGANVAKGHRLEGLGFVANHSLNRSARRDR
jgi:hypothetical protein